MSDFQKSAIGAALWGLPTLLLCLLYCWKAYDFQIHDFANYYFGAYAILNGFFDAQVFDALHLNQKLLAEGFDFLYVSYYPNTPFLAFSFIPLNLLDWQSAKLVFNILGTGLFLFSLLRLFKRCQIQPYFLLLIPVLFFNPIKNNLLFGQVYFVLFFLLTEGLLLYESNKKARAAIFWSIAILWKVFPVLLFFWFLIKRDFKSIVYLGTACLVLLLISVPICGLESWVHFATEIFPKSSAGMVYNGFTPRAKSATMLFKNLFVFDAMLNPKPLINNAWLFDLVSLIYKVALLSICGFVSLKYKKNALLVFSFWMLASLLIGPTNSSYSKLFLIFPLVAILTSMKGANFAKRNSSLVGILLVFLISNIPMPYFYDLPLLLKFPKVYLMLLFLGFLYWQFFARPNWKVPTMFALLFAGLSLLSLRSKQTLPDYVLLEDPYPTMLTNFGEKQGKLYYQYWNAGGIIEEKISKLPISAIDETSVKLVDGQIYYNGFLTNSPDNKRVPKLVNGKEIFYLSDANRGTGFYTLRKIVLD